jgi:hypothetical protein
MTVGLPVTSCMVTRCARTWRGRAAIHAQRGGKLSVALTQLPHPRSANIGEGGKAVIRPYTPVSHPDEKGHFDLVVKARRRTHAGRARCSRRP